MAEVETALLPVLDDTVERLQKRMENEIPMDLERGSHIVTQTRNMSQDENPRNCLCEFDI